jgi:hypothetical protein
MISREHFKNVTGPLTVVHETCVHPLTGAVEATAYEIDTYELGNTQEERDEAFADKIEMLALTEGYMPLFITAAGGFLYIVDPERFPGRITSVKVTSFRTLEGE